MTPILQISKLMLGDLVPQHQTAEGGLSVKNAPSSSHPCARLGWQGLTPSLWLHLLHSFLRNILLHLVLETSLCGLLHLHLVLPLACSWAHLWLVSMPCTFPPSCAKCLGGRSSHSHCTIKKRGKKFILDVYLKKKIQRLVLKVYTQQQMLFNRLVRHSPQSYKHIFQWLLKINRYKSHIFWYKRQLAVWKPNKDS